MQSEFAFLIVVISYSFHVSSLIEHLRTYRTVTLHSLYIDFAVLIFNPSFLLGRDKLVTLGLNIDHDNNNNNNKKKNYNNNNNNNNKKKKKKKKNYNNNNNNNILILIISFRCKPLEINPFKDLI